METLKTDTSVRLGGRRWGFKEEIEGRGVSGEWHHVKHTDRPSAQKQLTCDPPAVIHTPPTTDSQSTWHLASLWPGCMLAQPYVYPQAFVQPSLVLPTQVSTSVSTSPYLDYSTAYTQYAQAAFEQQYPYAASPAGFLGYSYATSPTATAGPAPAATAPATVHPTLPSAAGPGPAFLHYAPQQHIQPDRMQ
ncbi:hypothetical protein INR49_012668 [Caranx melampygus]|nr:hypothetical protein INR49_012668 [Caranx melampygus]